MATENYARHESQLRVLELLDELRVAILQVPPQDRVNWFGASNSIHVSLETMRAMFPGQAARRNDETGIITVAVGDVTFAARGEAPSLRTTELVL